jgi:hypothetical protein
MLTAYVDECGQQSKGLVIVGGFIGHKEEWENLGLAWRSGFVGTQREHLHLAELRFKKESEKRLLAKLGPLPHSCGLKGISGSVDVSDYHHLIKGTVAELHGHGYALALVPLILAIRAAIPADETFELVFEEQQALGFYREKMLSLIAYILNRDPVVKGGFKRNQLAGWRSMAKGETQLLEPADFLCYHLSHKSSEPHSVRAVWTTPICIGEISIRHLTGKAARDIFAIASSLRPQDKSELDFFRQNIRQGLYDPWAELLEERERKNRS